MTTEQNSQGAIVNASKKINGKKLLGDVKRAIVDAGGKPDQLGDDGRVIEPANFVDLFRVVGVITHVRVGTTQFGEWIGYMGKEVAAIVNATGEIFRGREILLPEEGNIVLADALEQAGMTLVGETTTGAKIKTYSLNNELTVALSVQAALAKNVVGYTYRVKPLMPIRASMSPAMMLLAQYGGSKAADVLKIAAPSTSAASTDSEGKSGDGSSNVADIKPAAKATAKRA